MRLYRGQRLRGPQQLAGGRAVPAPAASARTPGAPLEQPAWKPRRSAGLLHSMKAAVTRRLQLGGGRWSDRKPRASRV